jgi:hypothetical protein
MPKIESYKPGSFCWAELATSDPEAAKKFYTSMFGWSYKDNPMPNGVYTVYQVDGNDAAAMYQGQPGVPPNWQPFFATTDVDASAGKAKELGAEIVMGPMDIGPPGSMAVVKDPQGVFFSLWQGKENIGLTHGGPLNRVLWPEVATPDPAGAAAFYSGLFGWTTKPASGYDTAEYVELSNQGESFGGMLPMRGDMWKGIPPHWLLYVTVADCNERAEHAKSLGGSICVPPRDIPNVGRFSLLGDPQGARICIIQMTGQHAAA